MNGSSLAAIGGLWLALGMATAGEPPASSPGSLIVVNKLDFTVSIVDLTTETEVAQVPIAGVNPAEVVAAAHELTVAPDGKTAWVPLYSDTSASGIGGVNVGSDGRSIIIVSVPDRKAIGYLDLGKPMRPHTIVPGPNGLLYVNTPLDHSIAVIDPRTRKVIDTLPTGEAQAHNLTISKDGKRIYTCNLGIGSISVIDVVAKSVVARIAIGGGLNRVVLTPDDRYLFTNDESQPRVVMIDTATNQIVRYIKTPGVPYGLEMSPDGRWLLCTLPMVGQIAVIDASAWEVVRTFLVRRFPQFLLFRPDGQEAYVSTGYSRTVGIIDTKDWRVRKYIKVGSDPDGMAWAPPGK